MIVIDIIEMSLDVVVDFVIVWVIDGIDCVWISFDIDCIDVGFVFGIGWLEFGGLLFWEVLYLFKCIIWEINVCGMEVVEVFFFYDISDMILLMVIRVICDIMVYLVVFG